MRLSSSAVWRSTGRATAQGGRSPHRACGRGSQDQARERIGHVIARLEPIVPKICRLLEDADEDLIAFYLFPSQRWTKLR